MLIAYGLWLGLTMLFNWCFKITIVPSTMYILYGFNVRRWLLMSVFDFIFIQQHVLFAFKFHGCNLRFSLFGFLGWPNAKYNQNWLGYDSLSLSFGCMIVLRRLLGWESLIGLPRWASEFMLNLVELSFGTQTLRERISNLRDKSKKKKLLLLVPSFPWLFPFNIRLERN